MAIRLGDCRAGVTILHGEHHTVVSLNDFEAYESDSELFKSLVDQEGSAEGATDGAAQVCTAATIHAAWAAGAPPPGAGVVTPRGSRACSECVAGRFDILVCRGLVEGRRVDGPFAEISGEDPIFDGDTVMIRHHNRDGWAERVGALGASLAWRRVEATGAVPPIPACQDWMERPEAVSCALPEGRVAMLSKDERGGLWLSVLNTNDGVASKLWWDHTRTNKGIGPPRDCQPKEMTAVYYDGEIFFFGSAGCGANVYALDVEAQTWRSIRHSGFRFETPILHAAATVVGHCMVVTGGSPDGFDRTFNHALALDLRRGRECWHALPDMPSGVAHHGIAVTDGWMYCVMGDHLYGGIAIAPSSTMRLNIAGLIRAVDEADGGVSGRVLEAEWEMCQDVAGDIMARNPARWACQMAHLSNDVWVIPCSSSCNEVGETPFVRDAWNLAVLPPKSLHSTRHPLFTVPPLKGARPAARMSQAFVKVGGGRFVMFGGVAIKCAEWPAEREGAYHFPLSEVSVLEWRVDWSIERMLWLGNKCADSVLSRLPVDVLRCILEWLRLATLEEATASMSVPQPRSA